MIQDNLQNLRQVESWTTSQVLARQAKVLTEKTAIQFIGGQRFSYAELYRQSRALACGLNDLGIQPQDKVATLLDTSPEFCLLWLAVHQADAVLVALNTELVGDFLIHAMNLSQSTMLVCHPAQAEKILAVKDQLSFLQKLVVIDGGDLPVATGLDILPFSRLRLDWADAPESVAKPTDLACLIFTSGTTGPSKAVMMPHAHCYLYGLGTIENLHLKETDSYYICLPLYHANGLLMQLYACLIRGATAIIRARFSASNWLSDIRHNGATHTNLLGVMSEFIDRQPPSGQDRQHNLRVVAAAPASARMIQRFEQRFGIQMVELYGMSEVNIPLYTPLEAPRPGSCGKVYDRYFEVRIADADTDQPVAAGNVGEIQVRPRQAGGFMSGYFQMPQKTVEAWRNLWFHTGDAGRMDEDGYFYFVDRLKDCLRRRGENISSFEVESVLLTFPGIEEAAVFGVPSEIPDGEEEVMAVLVSPLPIDFNALLAHCKGRMPGYALPRFFRRLEASQMPRTGTNKIQKNPLRQQGVTPDTWDSQT
ncbi:AMP-binding protein [Bowmanella dokdonensis]|uniref:AMP-binding protein n=1 Tax=Bowmanella dokdonensis TaxID=751969 RepID=A0A939IQJ0_9ALTE|nr:AMP-binding protein [Bowmanella dokdonensis]MBN7826995.1 AMP-binding protein [Bowmanella dokdonensis]